MMTKKNMVNSKGWQSKSRFAKKKNAKLMHMGNIPSFSSLGIKPRQKTTTERGQFE